jgi:hypothetical protein
MSDQMRRPGTGEGPPGVPDDAMARLLVLAGPRQPVPAEVASRVRAAVHARWRRRIDVRARRRRVWLATLAAAAMVVVGVGTSVWYTPPRRTPAAEPPPLRSVGQVVAVMGEGATMLLPASGRPVGLASGETVAAGAEIITTSSARISLRTGDGVSVRVDVRSRIRFLSESELALESGAVYVDNPPRAATHTRIEIRTAMGVAADMGTQFETRVDARGLRVRVREGTVIVRRGPRSDSVREGEELAVDASGAVERGRLAATGAEWTWAVDMAVAPVIEGRTLGQLLEWASREGGWRVEYADTRLARSAPAVVLHGSIVGLTPASALDAVLPACGLAHSVRDGVLLIEEIPGGER